MRLVIIGLTVVFFILSAIITFKAPELPAPLASSVPMASYQDDRQDVTPESGDDAIKKLIEAQDANRALVTDLQVTIAQLEEKLATKETALESSETIAVEDKPETAAIEDKLKITATENRSEATTTGGKSRILVVFGGGTFRSGYDVINDVAMSTIEKLVEEISGSPGGRVIIEGHTDNIPTGKPSRDNMELSLLRAKAIANILITHGISRDRITEIGYGDTRPISSNGTEAGRAKNRRVEVKLVSEEGRN